MMLNLLCWVLAGLFILEVSEAFPEIKYAVFLVFILATISLSVLMGRVL